MKPKIITLLFVLLMLPGAQCSSCRKEKTQSNLNPIIMDGDTLINRKPAVAGTFYPGNRDELIWQLEKMFTNATPDKKLGRIVALIAPHAGYVYSGVVAASAFNQLSRETYYDHVFLIGSSHHASFDGAALYTEGNFITPLGQVKVNIPISQQLIRDHPSLFRSIPEAHGPEHSLEVQLPFLQYLYRDRLQIVPILLGTQKPATIKKIAQALEPYVAGNNLFVISTDFSHYPGYKDACAVDELTAAAILKNSSAELRQVISDNASKGIPNLATSICGWTSMLTFLEITENNPAYHYHEIRYMNSGDVPIGDKDRVVGYHALAVTVDQKNTLEQEDGYSLSETEKKALLSLARNTIKQYLATGQVREVDAGEITDQLSAPSGAFVTLNKKGSLRGCIGRFDADLPLYKVVQEMAISAATRDTRFTPVTSDELKEIEIEISVLTPMRKIQSTDEIVLGKHGIYLKKGRNSGTYLPQVATQTQWNLEEFLGHCARDKAGIGWNGWKEADIYIYEAYVFGE